MELKPELLFPQGKRKALTFSYDDATIYDRELVALMNKYGMKGTFNLNSGLFSTGGPAEIDGMEIDFSRIDAQEVKDLYEGHEVAAHTVNHPSLTELSANMSAEEVLKDRKNLEELVGYPVTGFAYPYGTYNEGVEDILAECGIVYARTVVDTLSFDLPQEFLEWHPTCHQNHPRLMELAEAFCKGEGWTSELFYVWGHSYEFKRYDNWQMIEELFKYLQDYKEKIWIATNLEIRDYVHAYRQVQKSTDGNIWHNPTDRDLWYGIGNDILCIHAGETQRIM